MPQRAPERSVGHGPASPRPMRVRSSRKLPLGFGRPAGNARPHRGSPPARRFPEAPLGAHRAGLAQRQSNGFVTCNTTGNIPPILVKLQGHRISQCSSKCRKHWVFPHLARLFPVAALRAFEHQELLGNCWAFGPFLVASTSTQMCPFHGQKCGFRPPSYPLSLQRPSTATFSLPIHRKTA